MHSNKYRKQNSYMKREDIQYAFNTAKLQKGDILLINDYEESLRKKMGGAKYTHAALYMGDAFIMEANGYGVTMNHIFSYGFINNDDALVYRPINATKESIENVIFFARAKMGNEFSTREALRTRDYRNTEEKEHEERMFCSRLVAQSYEKAGIKLVHNSDYCAPIDFMSTDALEQVPDVLEPVDTDDWRNIIEKKIKERESGDDMIWFSELFEKLQALYVDSNIQYFDKLVEAGLKSPENDEKCIKEIEACGYFNFKDRIMASFPWIETTETFAEYYPETEDRLWFLLNQENHFEKTYLPIFKQNASTFWLMSVMYPESKLLQYLSSGFRSILDDAENLLDKMYQLFDFTLADVDGCRLFYKKLHEETLKIQSH